MTNDPILTEVLEHTWPVLLDFDGPVTHLFIDGRNVKVASQMRSILYRDQIELPDDIKHTRDPLAVLRWSALHSPEPLKEEVEAASISGEVAAANTTEPTLGGHEFLASCKTAGRPVVIVSNNAEEAIRTYLARHHLETYVAAVMARTLGKPELMKPHPDVINRALRYLGQPAKQCCMIGDSITDMEVAIATGVHPIGYAKSPLRKRELQEVRAAAIVTSMHQLAEAIQRSSSGLIL